MDYLDMNTYKQSKSSIIFSTCWHLDGATSREVFEALTAAGFTMREDNNVVPMLKTYQRKGWLSTRNGLWSVRVGAPRTARKSK
jgi:hypothetical protein